MNELRIEGQSFALIETNPEGDLEDLRYVPWSWLRHLEWNHPILAILSQV